MKQKGLSVRQTGLAPIVIVVLITILAVGGYLIYKLPRNVVTPQAPQTTSAPSPTPIPSPAPTICPTAIVELPPLYPGIEWVSVQTMPISFRTITGNDVTLQNAYHIESAPLKEKPDDFLQFYQKKLAAMGWQKTYSSSIAGGERYRYEKNGRYFNFGYYTALGVPGKVLPAGFRALVEHN